MYKSAPDDVQSSSSSSKHERTLSSASVEPQQSTKKQKTYQVFAAKSIPYSKETQIKFEDQLLKAFVSSGTAFNKISDPEVQTLFKDFFPSATVPSRQRLEKQILRRVVVQIEGEMKSSLQNKLVTLSCDGWQDVSRKHLVAFIITSGDKVSFYRNFRYENILTYNRLTHCTYTMCLQSGRQQQI